MDGVMKVPPSYRNIDLILSDFGGLDAVAWVRSAEIEARRSLGCIMWREVEPFIKRWRRLTYGLPITA